MELLLTFRVCQANNGDAMAISNGASPKNVAITRDEAEQDLVRSLEDHFASLGPEEGAIRRKAFADKISEISHRRATDSPSRPRQYQSVQQQ